MANSLDAETPHKRYLVRSKRPASSSSMRTAVARVYAFESPQKKSLGNESVRRMRGRDIRSAADARPVPDPKNMQGRKMILGPKPADQSLSGQRRAPWYTRKICMVVRWNR
jgi:hypothetical protein